MNLVGKRFKHKMFGTGTVSLHVGDLFTVDFSAKTSKFQYNEATFTKFLTAEDPAVHAALLKEFEEIRIAEAQKKYEEELAKKKAEEARLLALAAEKKATEDLKSAKKTLVKQERIPGKRMAFYVFQGGTFEQESRGGYMWAPISNRSGSTCHHWDRLLDVHPDDIILHGYNASVQTVSIARDYCYESKQPEELRTEDLWDLPGRRVDCDYTVFNTPINTSHFTEDILRLCKVKYAPFNKDGTGNMGYLYELNRELAQIFLRAAVAKNPYLEELDYISEFLAESDES